MEKRITGILAAFMLAVLAGSGMVQAAAIGTPYVAEQAIGKAPNMKAYVTGSKMKKNAAVTGKIGDIELTQNGDITTFQKSGEKMNYIILMDNSGSVNETQFAEAKEQLKNLRKSLKKGDEMTLYTVGTDNAGGEKTQVFARKVKGKDKEKKEQKSDCKKIEKIPYLKSANIKTVLYRSINQILKEQASPEKRTVLLLITDGEDDSQGKDINNVSTAKTVKEASIPVYGIMLNRKPPKSGSSAEADEKISYTRNQILEEKNSRGYYYDCSVEATPESVDAAFKTLTTLWQKETYVVNLTASTNQTAGRGKLALTVNNSAVGKIYVDYSAYDKDSDAPVLTGDVEEVSSNSIKFSIQDQNGVNNMDANEAANYMIQTVSDNGEGKVWSIESINTAASGNQITVTLTTSEELYNDSYTLHLTNIRDKSQDQNEMDVTAEFTITTGLDAKKVEFQNIIKSYWWIGLIVLVVIIGVIIVIVIRRKKTEVVGVDPDELEKADSKKIRLTITDRAGMIKDVEWNVEGSLFVGRSDICNIFFDDDRLSKQHFVIEVNKMGCYIVDLESTNGTFVNGVKITNRRMLLDGDVITAGREKFVFHLPKQQLETQDVVSEEGK